MKKTLYAGEAAAFLLMLVLLVVWRDSVSKGIYQAISYSLSVLIPSILPFMFVSGLFSRTPACRILCKALSPISRYLFRLNAAAAPALLFGLTCGYPVGAKLTAELLESKKISEEEAGRLLLFTMNPGIPFCILFLGGTVLRNTAAGLAIYLSVTAAGIIAGFCLGLLSPCSPAASLTEADSEPMVLSVKKAADSTVRACLNMSFYIVIFWGGMALFHESGAFGAIVRYIPLPFADSLERAGLLSFLFEVTGGISDSAALGLPPFVFVLGLSFGGICIHLQLFAFFRRPPIRYGYFLLWRLLQCVLSAGVFSLLQAFFPWALRDAIQTTASFYDPVFGGLKGNFVGSFCLMLLFITYLFVSEKETVETGRKK